MWRLKDIFPQVLHLHNLVYSSFEFWDQEPGENIKKRLKIQNVTERLRRDAEERSMASFHRFFIAWLTVHLRSSLEEPGGNESDQCSGQWVTPGTRDRWVAVAPSYHSRASLCHEWKLPSGSWHYDITPLALSHYLRLQLTQFGVTMRTDDRWRGGHCGHYPAQVQPACKQPITPH